MAITTIRKPHEAWNPLTGIDWVRVRRAYGIFTQDPAAGISHISEAARHSRWELWVEARLARQAPALTDRDIAIDLETLAQLPADTLGGAYARHIRSNGLDPEKFITPRDRHWVQKRSAYGHDIGHVIVGFDSTPIGEFGLAAFCWVQRRDMLNAFVLSFVPWTCLGYPHWTRKIWAAVWRGMRLGRCSQSTFAYPFEDNWDKPLAAVRRDLGIDRTA